MDESVKLGLAHKVPLLKHYKSQLELLLSKGFTKISKHELHERSDSVAVWLLEELKDGSKHSIDIIIVASVVHLELLEEVSAHFA